ncbi:MAG: hypothetical protein ABFR63_09870 [Thermodesulfobacteriota bacterium]
MLGARGNAIVPMALLSWVPLVLWAFSRFEPRKAAAGAFVIGWMFLPEATIPIPGLPDFTKMFASCVGVLLGAFIFDRKNLLAVRLSVVDIPMILWCTCPLLSSLANGLGAYDGMSESLQSIITWGLPYFVAKVYFADREGLTILALAIFIGGIIYIPFCFIEMAISPQLHRMTYGFSQANILQSMRAGGFRPVVYMQHGLMVAMWMVSSAFIGIWFYYAKLLPEKLLFLPTKLFIPAVLFTTLLMKSTGALGLFILGLAALFSAQRFKVPIIMIILLMIPPAYMISRSTDYWDGRNLSSFVEEKFSADRAQSLQFRFDNEYLLIDKAMAGSFFGWGGWGRSRVYDDDGRDITITDGLWIITMGTRGIYGIILMSLTIVMPMLLLLIKVPLKQWATPRYAAASVFATLLTIYMVDNLLNAMVNPIFMLFNGGINGMLMQEISETETEVSLDLESGTTLQPVPATRLLGDFSMSHSFPTRLIGGNNK